MREKEGYRETLEFIVNRTGGRTMLTLKDVRELTGIKDNRTLKKRYSFNGGYISATRLAREL